MSFIETLHSHQQIHPTTTLTERPIKQPLVEMTQADLAAEGFPNYTFEQFINEFFDGKNQTVWVICFEFTSNSAQESSVTVEVVESNDNQSVTDTQLNECSALGGFPDLKQLPNPKGETNELSDEEEKDRLYFERKVERAFYEAGKALYELRKRRLYRSTHKTFEDYCQERFGYSRRKMDYLIAGSQVYKNLSEGSETRTIGSQTDPPDEKSQMRTNCSQKVDGEMRTNCSQILPTRESQVRPLTKLKPHQQREAWTKAVEECGGKVPSSRVVKDIVDQIRERNQVPNPWREGDVAMIMVKDNPELRGKGGCWCVISEVHNFSCTVRLWDGEYQVKPENLKELPYSNEQQKAVRELSDRLTKLYDPEMEDTAKAILSSLGKIDRPYLTELEEKLLTFLEGN